MVHETQHCDINLFTLYYVYYSVSVCVQDVEPGRPVRSQLASAAKSPEEAFRRMKNKTFVVETKFDGAPFSVLGKEVLRAAVLVSCVALVLSHKEHLWWVLSSHPVLQAHRSTKHAHICIWLY